MISSPLLGRRSLSTRTTWLIIAGSGLVYAAFIARTAFRVGHTLYFSLFDDAMVSMRYAQNLAHGHGLVWNPGEQPVEGFTNLLWTLWMALLHLTGIPEAKLSLGVMVTGVLLLFGTVVVTGAITRRLAPDRMAPALAMVLTALFYPLVYWTLRGMEVGLLAFLLAVTTLLALRLEERPTRRDLVLLFVAVLAAVGTRSDAAVPALVVAGYLFLRRRRAASLTTALALAAGIAGQTAFSAAYYGHPLPNTYYLKVHGIPLSVRIDRGLISLAAVTLEQLWAPLIVIGAYAARRRLAVPPAAWLLAGTFASTALYSVYVGGDAWEFLHYADRYLTPSAPLLLALAAVGLDDLRRADWRRERPLAFLVAGAFAAAFALSLAHPLPLAWLQYGRDQLRPQVVAVVLALLWPVLARALTRADTPETRLVRFASAGLAGLLLLAGASGWDWARWGAKNATYAPGADAAWARFGVELRRTTAPDATVATFRAGALAYFSQRPIVDELGKSDRAIALTPPRGRYFHPGHDKWDYAYSIGRLRPDLIVELWRPTPADVAHVCAWGYTSLAPGVFARKADSRVDDVVLRPYARKHRLDAPESASPRGCP